MTCRYPECPGAHGGTICRPDCALPSLRGAAEQALAALEQIETLTNRDWSLAAGAIAGLRSALRAAEHEQKPAALMTTWISETEAVTEPLFKAPPLPRRLSDSEISEVWFQSKITGLTETSARLLIRAAERRMGAG